MATVAGTSAVVHGLPELESDVKEKHRHLDTVLHPSGHSAADLDRGRTALIVGSKAKHGKLYQLFVNCPVGKLAMELARTAATAEHDKFEADEEMDRASGGLPDGSVKGVGGMREQSQALFSIIEMMPD